MQVFFVFYSNLLNKYMKEWHGYFVCLLLKKIGFGMGHFQSNLNDFIYCFFFFFTYIYLFSFDDILKILNPLISNNKIQIRKKEIININILFYQLQ